MNKSSRIFFGSATENPAFRSSPEYYDRKSLEKPWMKRLGLDMPESE